MLRTYLIQWFSVKIIRNPKLRGQPQGIRQVLLERGLWQDHRKDGSKFLLSCPKGKKQFGCDPALNGECCATTILQSKKDFKEQKGMLQELVESTGDSAIFYPKFHCELNFIERFWYAAKYYTRENCGYTLDDLRKTIPPAFQSVPVATINRHYLHCVRTIEAYKDGFRYGTKEFVERTYKNYRRVVESQKNTVTCREFQARTTKYRCHVSNSCFDYLLSRHVVSRLHLCFSLSPFSSRHFLLCCQPSHLLVASHLGICCLPFFESLWFYFLHTTSKMDDRWCSACGVRRSATEFEYTKSGNPRKTCSKHTQRNPQKKRPSSMEFDDWAAFISEIRAWKTAVRLSI